MKVGAKFSLDSEVQEPSTPPSLQCHHCHAQGNCSLQIAQSQ
jgi:hypothetical protein